MSRTLKAALVGCGSVSQRGVLPHLSLPDAREKVQLVAVVDTVAERAQQSAERYGVPAYFTDIETMLARADVDLVLVNGYGFPRHEGGPLFWASRQDPARLTATLVAIAAATGYGFKKGNPARFAAGAKS